MKYIKKPVIIEAFKLGVDCMPDWFMDKVTTNEIILRNDKSADIETLEGWHHASFGDYIIKGIKDEVYSCKPDIFAMTYDKVNEEVL